MSSVVLEKVSKCYANGVEALKSVSFSVEPGDFFALLGPNGAGKSTLIGILTSLVAKSSGKVTISGFDIDRDFRAAKACIGVVPQEFNFNSFNRVLNIIVTQAGYYGISPDVAKKRAEFYLRALDLWDKRNAVARTLSGGMKRRLMIARALIHEPKVLILDEPTAGVDIEIRHTMWQFLQKINAEGVTIILTTHYLEEAENLCRNVAIIDRGEIIQNTSMAQLLSTLETESVVLYLQEPVAVLPESLKAFVTLQDTFTAEALLPKERSLSELLAELNAAGLHVARLRNKSNRLETLFLQMTARSTKTP
eukprot:TRINITY_DN14124_c0_g2_i6.p1 TRINITY_DN14124_c0_g2~~TRINITY_DN14124_c0_g2_i6.p1  ORF type:complete len:308 (+),score=-37.92 TRINITY_DN14124_c0_g2_i6:769-1692(+)